MHRVIITPSATWPTAWECLYEFLPYESFAQHINLLLRGAMTYQIDLGTDSLGNLTRLNNALDKLPERLAGARSQHENLNVQAEAAKLELGKPFEQEAELEEKEARLALLNADLNIDGDGGVDVENDPDSREDGDEPEEDIYEDAEPRSGYGYGQQTAKTKPSMLDRIRSIDSGEHNDLSGRVNPGEHSI